MGSNFEKEIPLHYGRESFGMLANAGVQNNVPLSELKAETFGKGSEGDDMQSRQTLTTMPNQDENQ